MAKSPQIIERIKEVRNALLDQKDRKTIVEQFGKKWKVSIKSIDVYISKAKQLIKEDSHQLETIERQKLESRADKNIYHKLTLEQKLDILYRIATGKIKIPAIDGKGQRVLLRPNYIERMKAIELENEMTGEGYRPEPAAGTTINGPVYNTVIRKTVFKAKTKTSAPQSYQDKSE